MTDIDSLWVLIPLAIAAWVLFGAYCVINPRHP